MGSSFPNQTLVSLASKLSPSSLRLTAAGTNSSHGLHLHCTSPSSHFLGLEKKEGNGYTPCIRKGRSGWRGSVDDSVRHSSPPLFSSPLFLRREEEWARVSHFRSHFRSVSCPTFLFQSPKVRGAETGMSPVEGGQHLACNRPWEITGPSF